MKRSDVLLRILTCLALGGMVMALWLCVLIGWVFFFSSSPIVAASVVSGAAEIILESFWPCQTGKPRTRQASLMACLALIVE